MEYKKSMDDVKKALKAAQPGRSPAVTEQSPGVRANRALKRLEKVASA